MYMLCLSLHQPREIQHSFLMALKSVTVGALVLGLSGMATAHGYGTP